MTHIILHQGDTLAVLRGMAAASVHCGVTSPPYWGLRDYGVAGQLGLEPTIEEYVAKMVEVFREFRRVLRPDGTLWLNMGDSYCGSGGAGGDYNPGGLKDGQPKFPGKGSKGIRGGSPKHADYSCEDQPNRYPQANLKAKDLCGIPWRVALALLADGWWLRSDIIWSKPNPMPESCTDRPTTAHEHIFLLTKSARYFYDAEAMKKSSQANAASRKRAEYGRYALENGKAKRNFREGKPDYLQAKGNDYGGGNRSLRSVWEIATQPLHSIKTMKNGILEKYDHFAAFPTELVRRCVAAGTSEKGCCPTCGSPWVRVMEKQRTKDGSPIPAGGWPLDEAGRLGPQGEGHWRFASESATTGWRPTCKCLHTEADLIPAIVLDPFAGSGTTGLVAAKMGRDAQLIELKPEYVQMTEKRLNAGLGMLAEIEIILDQPEAAAP